VSGVWRRKVETSAAPATLNSLRKSRLRNHLHVLPVLGWLQK